MSIVRNCKKIDPVMMALHCICYLPLSAATDLGGGTGANTVGNTAPGNWLSNWKQEKISYWSLNKWPTSCKQHFEINFLEQKFYFDYFSLLWCHMASLGHYELTKWYDCPTVQIWFLNFQWNWNGRFPNAFEFNSMDRKWQPYIH